MTTSIDDPYLCSAMAANEDFYQILGVAKDADADTIKKAYRKLAMQYHPDKNPGDKAAEDKFKQAARAYEVLSNKEKRSRYDRFGAAGAEGFQQGPGYGDVNDIFSAFGDIFGDFFGGTQTRSRARNRPQRGSDLRYVLEVDFLEVMNGAQREIQFEVEEPCKTCSGSGAEAGTKPEKCGHCGGAGQVVRQQGFFSISTPCPVCGGDGQVIRKPCKDCKGRGIKQVLRRLMVNIPNGVDSGNQLRLSGEGEAGRLGGPSGDLYVEIRVKPNSRFQRDGKNLHGQLEASYLQAILGSKIEFETLDGKVEVEIPPGSQPGSTISLRAKGLPSLKSKERGDMLLKLTVKLPKKLGKDEEELLRQIAKSAGEPVSPSKTFFRR